MTIKINKSDLETILEQVSDELHQAFETEKSKLAKAEESSSAEESKEESSLEKDAMPPKKEDTASHAPEASEATQSAPPVDEASTPAPAPEASEPAVDPAAPADPAAEAGPQVTPELLQSEYAKLSPEELEMHLQAALAAKAAVQPAPEAPMAPAPVAPPPAAPEASLPPPDLAMKAELTSHDKASGGQIKGGKLGKSEEARDSEIAELKALVKSQAEDIENLAQVTKAVLERPLRKAVTSVAHLPKMEVEKAPLTKAEIHSRLNKLSSSPELKKSDRQLINDFYDGRVKADALAPLFEDYNK